MTIPDIAETVTQILHKDDAYWNMGSSNMIYNALNEARKEAEKLHDFSVCRRRGYFSPDSLGEFNWNKPVWLDGINTSRMRKGINWFLYRGWTPEDPLTFGNKMPIMVVDANTLQAYAQQQDVAGYERLPRYPGDEVCVSSVDPLFGKLRLETMGRKMAVKPTYTAGDYVVVDGYTWWFDWTPGWKAWTRVKADPKSITGANIVINVQLTIEGTAYNYSQTLPGTNTREQFLAAIQTLLNSFDSEEVWAEIEGSDIVVNAPAGSYARISFQGSTLVEDYRSTDPDMDWWEKNASEYLIYATVCKLNYRDNMFVGNREGNLPAPQKQADAALNRLIMNDEDGEAAGKMIYTY